MISLSECGFPSLTLAGQGDAPFGSVCGLGWSDGFAAGLVATLAAQDHEEAELPKLLAVGLYPSCDGFQDYVFSASAAMLAPSWDAFSSCTWDSIRAAAAVCHSEIWALVSAASAAAFLPGCSLKNFGEAERKIQSTHCLFEVMALFPQVWYLLLRDGHVLGLRFERTLSSAAAACSVALLDMVAHLFCSCTAAAFVGVITLVVIYVLLDCDFTDGSQARLASPFSSYNLGHEPPKRDESSETCLGSWAEVEWKAEEKGKVILDVNTDSFQLMVVTLTGRTLLISVHDGWTVHDLSLRLEKDTGILLPDAWSKGS